MILYSLSDLHRFHTYTVNVNAYSKWGAGPNKTITVNDETSGKYNNSKGFY